MFDCLQGDTEQKHEYVYFKQYYSSVYSSTTLNAINLNIYVFN